jgi:PBP1b-binding outer membrane lipoprotein LpoB
MKRYTTQIIIAAIFFLLALLLAGCAKNEPVSETIADNAINATNALEQSLPAECKTAAINTQITVIKTQIKAITSACETEKNDITRDKLKWKYSFWVLIGIILAYVFKRMTK